MWNHILWRQFGAAVDMLEAALHACPDELWCEPAHPPTWKSNDVVGFWYVVYHTLFWLDCYLSGGRADFAPPHPYTLAEREPWKLPARPYTKQELQTYLDYGREKCRTTLAQLTDASAANVCELPWGSLTFAELLVYNLRHVQHHTGQLQLMLRQNVAAAPGWIIATSSPLR
jgi:hypothetical protein